MSRRDHGSARVIQWEAASPSDADTLADLRVEAMRESLERAGRFDTQRARDRFLSTFSPESTQLLRLDGKLAGLFAVTNSRQGLRLEHLYILPAWQGKGLGAAALDLVLARADRQAVAIRVTALKGSEANGFYLRHGFVLEHDSEFDHHYVRLPHAL